MAWKCYSCGTDNSNKDAVCTKCGNTVAAPRRFYSNWIWGAALFFFIFYLAGTMAGGVIVEAVAAPNEATLLRLSNQLGMQDGKTYKNLLQVEPERLAAARAVGIHYNKKAMSPALKLALQWTLPVILFIICGLIVGFISDGYTIIEPGLGSIIGHAGAVALIIYGIESPVTSWLAYAVGVLPGAGLGILGAWIGEKIQDKKDRAGGITA